MMKNTKTIVVVLLITIISLPVVSLAKDLDKTRDLLGLGQIEDPLEKEFETLKNKDFTVELIHEISSFLDRLEKSEMIFAKKHSLILKANLLLDDVKSKTKDSNISELHHELKNNIDFEIRDKVIYLKFPEIDSNYKITCSIIDRDDKKQILVGDIKENLLKLPNLNTKKNLEIAISIINKKTQKEETGFLLEKTFEDKEKPILNYMYIKDDVVYLDYDDNYQLAKEAVKYKILGEKDFRPISDNKFSLKEPHTIILIVEDLFGNKNEYKLDINNNNSPIYGRVPTKILKELLQGEFIIPDYADNIIIGLKDKTIDIFQIYNDLIKDFFKLDDASKVKINGESSGSILLEKIGLKKIDLEDDNGKILNIYVYVVESMDKLGSNLKNIKMDVPKDEIMVMKELSLNLLDYLEIEQMNRSTDISNIFVKEPGSKILHPISDMTNLIKNSNNKIEILDILEDKVFTINIINNLKVNENTTVKQEYAMFNSDGLVPEVEFKQYYLDVKDDHWASNAITRLTDSGVLRGYDDRNFKPNDHMTIKEFLVMFGRFINLQDPSILNPSIKNREQKFEHWGELEANNVISRIEPDIFNKLDTNDFSRNIKKEEVAFLISNTIILNDDISQGANLNDISDSKFKNEIEQLYLNGISKGMPDGSFGPSRMIVRSEVVELFNNMLK